MTEFKHMGLPPKMVDAKDLGCLVVSLQGVTYPPDMQTSMRMTDDREDYESVKSFQVLEMGYYGKSLTPYIVVKVGEHNLRVIMRKTDVDYLLKRFKFKLNL